MKKKIISLLFVGVILFVVSGCASADVKSESAIGKADVEIKSVYELSDATLYFSDDDDADDDADPEENQYLDKYSPVIFVYEYPFFGGGGNAAKKMNAIYEAQMRKINDAGRIIAGVKEFKREKASYTEDDYFDALHTKEYQFLDITTCSVFEKDGFVSVTQLNGWYMGGVHDLNYEFHNFDLETGRELDITDVFAGAKEEIVDRLQKLCVEELGENGLNGEPSGEPKFGLTEQGVVYAPDNIYGFNRGFTVTVPYNDAMLKKPLVTMVTIAAASADEKEKMKEVLSLSGSISAFSNLGDFTKVFGEPHDQEDSEIAAYKYVWSASMGIPNVSCNIVALADKSQNVTGWGISIYALDPDETDGRSDSDKTDELFLMACRGMEERAKQASKVRVSGGTWGSYSEAFYLGGNGKIIRVVMTRSDDGYASILIDETSEEDARTRSLRLEGSNVNVREQPGAKAKILGRISSEYIPDSFSTDNEKQNQGEKFPWYKIRVDNPYTKFNGEGWVYGEFLTPVEYSLDEYEKSGCPMW